MTEIAAGGIVDRIRQQYEGEILCFKATKLSAAVGLEMVTKTIAQMRKHDMQAVANGTEQLGPNPIFVAWPADDDGDYFSIGLYSEIPRTP